MEAIVRAPNEAFSIRVFRILKSNLKSVRERAKKDARVQLQAVQGRIHGHPNRVQVGRDTDEEG